MKKLEIRHEDYSALRYIHLSGSLDSETADDLDDQMQEWIEIGWRWFAVELSGLDYVSSMGVSTLVGCLNQLQEVGGDMRLVNVPPTVKRALELLALWELFLVFPDRESLFASYQG